MNFCQSIVVGPLVEPGIEPRSGEDSSVGAANRGFESHPARHYTNRNTKPSRVTIWYIDSREVPALFIFCLDISPSTFQSHIPWPPSSEESCAILHQLGAFVSCQLESPISNLCRLQSVPMWPFPINVLIGSLIQFSGYAPFALVLFFTGLPFRGIPALFLPLLADSANEWVTFPRPRKATIMKASYVCDSCGALVGNKALTLSPFYDLLSKAL